MTDRRVEGLVAAAGAVLLVGLAAIVLAGPDLPEVLSQAQAEYDKHNYKQALDLAEKALAEKPQGKQLRGAQRMKALCLCMLRDRDGYRYAEEIIAAHKPFASDGELWRAMGYDRFSRWDRKRAYAYFTKAAENFEKARRYCDAAGAWFKAAECLLSRHDILPEQQKIEDYQQRRRIGIDKMLEIYDHITTLDIDEPRKAGALLLAGRATRREGTWAYAQKGLRRLTRCVEEFSLTHQAVEAQFEQGRTYEHFNKFVQAVRAYGKVITDFADPQFAERAKQRIDDINSPRLAVMVEKAYLPGEKPRLYWQSRNIKRIHLKAYRIDLVKAVAGMEEFDPAKPLIDQLARFSLEQVATWSFDTPDEGRHQTHSHLPDPELKQTTTPISVPVTDKGAYLIEASGSTRQGKSALSRCLVVLSDISAVAKADGDQVLVYVARAGSGKPVKGAKVALMRRYRRRAGSYQCDTDDAGLAVIEVPYRKSHRWLAAVTDGDDQAICAAGNYHWSAWGYRRRYLVYGFTDRPVYRPGQTANFKQIVRENKDGTYVNLQDRKLRVEIRDPKGEVIYAKDLITDRFGAVEGSLPIKADAPLGLYQINVSIEGQTIGYWQASGNRFRVEQYRKPEFKVTVEPAQADYRIGDEMKIKIVARYYFGQPVADADVNFTIRRKDYRHGYQWPRPWPWYYDGVHGRGGRMRLTYWPRFDELVAQGSVKTDANGEAIVTVKADPIKDHDDLDLKFVVEASVTDSARRVIRGSGEVKVTHAPFFIYATAAQAVYGPGDSVEINIKTADPNDKPVPGKFTVAAWKMQRVAKTVEKEGRQVSRYEDKLLQKLFEQTVDVPETGRASVRFTPDLTGRLKIVVAQADAEKPVEGSCELWVASKTGAEAHYAYSDLKLIPASDQYEIGQTMKLLVNTNKTDGYVLLTGEAEQLLFWRIVHVPANSKLVEIPVDKALTPNFTLTGTLIADGKIFRDSKKIVVPPTHRFIKVEATTTPGSMGGGDEGRYQPREKTCVKVKLTDMRTGKPIVGQVTAMLVDSSVYYIQPEFREAIEKAFYGYVRYNNVSTADSFSGPPSLNPPAVRMGGGPRRMNSVRKGFAGGAPEALMMQADRVAAVKSAPPAPAEDKAGQLVEPVVREHFRDTVLWAGSIVTDADGMAEIPVTLPDQLTTFALHVISVDQESRVGQARAEVVTTKRVIVRLQTGRFFTEGDHSYVTVIAHNYYDQPQALKLDLTASDGLELRKVNLAGQWRDYDSGDELDVTVPAAGEVRLDFLTTATRPGEVELLARARGPKESDAIQLTRPILEWGARKIAGAGGALKGTQRQEDAWTFVVPEDIKAGSQSLTVTLSPSIAAVALEALPFLARYPYGCVEQTMSRFLPTVVMRKTLHDAGISLDEIREHIAQRSADDPKIAAKYKFIQERIRRNPVYSAAEVDRMIAKGIARLAEMQHSDGGWGWWKSGRSNPYMTAYVAYGLNVARESDVKLPGGMLEKATKFLIDRASRPKSTSARDWWRRHVDNDNTRAYMLYVIGVLNGDALGEKALAGHLKRIYESRDDLTDYGRAYLALALHAAGNDDQARVVAANFDNTAIVDAKTGSAHWGRTTGWWYWHDGATETTAWVMQAMMTVSPDDKYIPMAVNWLVRNRRELAWHNTKSTAMVVYALARYAKAAGELDSDQTFEVVIDGAIRRTVRVTRDNLFSFDSRIVVPAEQLAPGEHTVKIARNGRGSLYWGAYLRYFTTAERIEAGGNQIAIRRKYYRLVPEPFTNTRTVWKDGEYVKEEFLDLRHKREPLEFGAEIASGELVEVELTVEADNNFEYVVFEDPKPAGCEPYRLTSGPSHGGGTYSNIELRDTKVVFFAAWLRQGTRTLSYRLVCEQPGTFRVLPASGEAMYSPFVEAISSSGKMVITFKPDD